MSDGSNGTDASANGATSPLQPPVSLLAELTHRCPLQCPYCSNPLALERINGELDTETWCRVIDEANDLGVLQTHFSGGEPTLRKDLADLIRHAAGIGQYTNLITAGVLLDRSKNSKRLRTPASIICSSASRTAGTPAPTASAATRKAMPRRWRSPTWSPRSACR